jgi:tetratricopeptide (TPR) repeat protein
VLRQRSMRRLAAAASLAILASASAAAQPNEYAGEAVALALEAQEYAIGIARSAAGNADPAAAIESAERAIGTARRALELDNSTALALSVLGLANRDLWHWREAGAAFEQAYALDANDPGIAFNYGWFSSFSGEHERAIEVARRAVALNPGSANAHRDLGIAFAFAGNEEGARAALGQCIAADPEIGICHIYLGFMLMRLGSYALAEEELGAAERLFGAAMSPAAASSLAHAYWRTGLTADAERLFERLSAMAAAGRVVGAGSWPLAYLAIGDEESAYDWLLRAVEKAERFEPDEGFFNMMIIKHNVQANPVLEEPRFRMLRDRIGGAQRSIQ